MAEYKSVEKDGVHYISCPSSVDSTTVPLETLVKSWLLMKSNIHIVDFKDTLDIKPNAYRAFVLFNQQLKAHKKTLYCMNANQKLLMQFKADGLTSVFVPVPNADDAKRRSASRPTLDVEFINPFLLAVKNVLEVQATLPLTPGKAYLRKPDERIPMEIAGVISLVSAKFTGSINLCFRAQVFLKIYERLTGEVHTEIHSEIEDAAGELLNMIFGQAKSALNDQKGYTFQQAIPTVMTGEKLRLHHQSRNPAIVLPFESPAGAFHLEILIDKS